MIVVDVCSRIVGTDTELPTVAVEVVHEQLTANQLISRTIEAQIHELEENYHQDLERISHALQRQYLTEPEVHEQANQGRISLSSATRPVLDSFDVQQEIAKAVEAFRRKSFLILVDGKQLDQLDEPVILTSSSKIVFIRLTPLVGG